MHITDRPILPPATIGIFGNGQLGRMLALAALRMGYKVITFGPDHDGCAINVCQGSIIGNYDNVELVAKFLEQCDVITLEFENIPESVHDIATGLGKTIQPGRQALRVSQDRIKEKSLAQSLGIPVPDFWALYNEDMLRNAEIIYPIKLKTVSGGYDGNGQRLVCNASELQPAWESLGKKRCIAERFVDFECELSVIVARKENDEMMTYRVFKNIHTDGILVETEWPWSDEIVSRAHIRTRDDAEHYARKLASELRVVGLLAVEYFWTRDGRLLFNELAPRPHNSGHVTIECSRTSQFEQHIRAICNLPFGDPESLCSGRMYNMIGDFSLEKILADRSKAIKIHRYGKKLRPGRKVGHITELR